MSKENENINVDKVNTPAGLTVEQLLKMFLDQNKETAASNKALAEALLESRKPFVDPKVVAEREQARQDRKMLIDQEMVKRSNAKKYCPHLNEGGNSNIKWHQHSNGIILGVCGSCRSEFDATRNREDALLLRANPKGIRNMGRAGEHARRGEGQIQL
jgi:hypothetical protein